MSSDTLPAEAFGLALEAFAGTYGDGTPLTVTEALERALLAAAPSIREQHRRQLALAVRMSCACESCKEFIAGLLGEPGQERSDKGTAG